MDDEASPRAVIREVLQGDGYEPVEAGDGLEGLANAEAVRPDVILLEGRMRGLDGYEVCRRLKANPRTQHIPVIFVTGVDDDEPSTKSRRERTEAQTERDGRVRELLEAALRVLAWVDEPSGMRRARP